MMKHVTTAVLAAAVVFAGGLASAQSATQETKDKTKAAAHHTGAAMTDAEITSAVKSKLLADKTVAGLQLDVDTSDHVVTLSGQAKSAAERAQAMRLARNTSGVKSVVDKITVGGTATTTTPTSGKVLPPKKDDGTHIIIKDDTTPMVKKGVEKTEDAAKAAGRATEHAAKKTADAVKNTDVKVKDDTKVQVHKDDGDPSVKTAGEATSDAAITSAIKTKMLADARVSGLKIDVDTSKGIVTLTGDVRSPAEKAAALDLARTQKGVKGVVDKLTVK